MKFLLPILIVIGTNALLYQPMQEWRLQKLTVCERNIAGFVKEITKERIVYTHEFESKLQKLVSAKYQLVTRDDYTNNPLPALVMVRRLVEEWPVLAWKVQGVRGLSQLGLGALRWPSTKDLDAAALSVMRAQWTYKLDINLLARGIDTGSYGPMNVTASDCFHMALTCRKYLFIEEALEWIKQALLKSNQESSSPSVETLMHYFVHLKCLTGNSKSSQATLIELFRKYPQTKINLKTQKGIVKAYHNMYMVDCNKSFGALEDQRKRNWYETSTKHQFEQQNVLCRDEVKTDSRLVCRYVHYQQPHLRFQPFKLEELQLDPPVVRFYDAVTDTESEALREFSSERMTIGRLLGTDGRVFDSMFRTSHVAWISPQQLDVNDRLTQRIADMTQLNPHTAEDSHVARYSVSGEILRHTDPLEFAGMPYPDDRFATLMFFLNEVKQGGNTVFLEWKVAVKPVKNSAILWFNFLRNGKVDKRSIHSGCPVLEGTKWIMNKWFRNRGHEFKMPCDLHQEDSYHGYYLRQ